MQRRGTLAAPQSYRGAHPQSTARHFPLIASRGKNIRAVTWMKSATSCPTFQFLRRRAENFQDLTVCEFEFTILCHQSNDGWQLTIERK
jgi:hypothetical protein